MAGDGKGLAEQQSFDEAGQAQKNALEALKEGAGKLAQEMMKKSGQGSGQPNEDPLGRTEGAVGGAGSDTRLPNASEMQRARAILEELRKRAAQPGRPKEELDYIDRLLRQF